MATVWNWMHRRFEHPTPGCCRTKGCPNLAPIGPHCNRCEAVIAAVVERDNTPPVRLVGYC